MKKLFPFITLLFSIFSFAQVHNYTTTISKEDSLKIESYRTKLSQYVNPKPDSALFYGHKIKEMATTLKYGKGIADADYYLGACFKRVQENDSAIAYFNKSLTLSKTLDYAIGKGRAYNSLGRIYYLLGKMDSSIVMSKKAIASSKGDSKTALMIIADSHTALATAYSRKNDMTNAITHLLKVDSIHQKSSLRPDVIAAAYQTLGNVYLELIDNSVEKITHQEDVPILLVVEDTKEICNYVTSIFENEYQVITANNGEDGIKKAIANVPDIIISDIMMPIKDGYELTDTIKNDKITAHIPIVLLIAKTDDADTLRGIKIGADAYISKPFNTQLLKATISNLLETRRKLQSRFAQKIILSPKEIAVSSIDKKFLERLQKVLDEQVTNCDFSASVFCEAMGVSRMQLHRKLKALTGYSTSEFIRNQRLKLAKQLIENNKISISEVGYTVGFNDPSYFSKCFKQEFGISPSDYSK